MKSCYVLFTSGKNPFPVGLNCHLIPSLTINSTPQITFLAADFRVFFSSLSPYSLYFCHHKQSILPIRRIHKLPRAPATQGGPLALKDVFILVSF